jgi:hypothetical protein
MDTYFNHYSRKWQSTIKNRIALSTHHLTRSCISHSKTSASDRFPNGSHIVQASPPSAPCLP